VAFTMITLDTGSGYRLADGTVPRARIVATPYVPMTNVVEIPALPIMIPLDVNGLAQRTIAATTDPGTTPAGNAYRFRIEVDGYPVHQFLAAVPHNAGSTVDISSLILLTAPPDFTPVGGGYTSEHARDDIAAALVAGPNVTITPDDAGNTIVIGAATTGGSGIPASTVDAKGDLIVGTANDTVARRAVGANGLALVANSANTDGVGWAAPAPAAHNHAATDVTSGTVAPARLGSGTASATTYLRGDSAFTDPTLQAPPVHAVGNSGTALTIDATNAAGWVKTITLTGNCVMTITAPGVVGRTYTLELVLTQDGTGGRTVTWPGSVQWPGGVAPVLSTAAAAVDRIVLITYNNGTTWFGNVVGGAASVVDIYRATKASDQTLASNTGAALGLSVTVASTSAADAWEVQAVLDVQANAANAATLVAELAVDGGSALSGQAIIHLPTSGLRTTCTQSWVISTLAVGSHTLALDAFVTTEAGSTYQVNGTHSNLTVRRFSGTAH
jgi:hypothetical protein